MKANEVRKRAGLFCVLLTRTPGKFSFGEKKCCCMKYNTEVCHRPCNLEIGPNIVYFF